MRRHALTLVGAALLGGLPASATAHGPAPAALEVVSLREGAPDVVRLNFGLAVRLPGTPAHFRYVCPARWGETERVPEVAVAPGGAVLVPLTEGVFAGDADTCAFTRAEAADWSAQTPVGIAAGDAVTLATRDAEGSRLWAVDAGAARVSLLESLPGAAIDSLAAGRPGAIWALGARPAPTLWHRDAAGLRSRPLVLDAAPQFLEVRWVDPAAPAHVFFVASVADGVRLYETPDGGATVVERLRAARALHGPVPLGDALIALADGVVWHRGAGAADFGEGEARPYTCLQALEGVTLACLDRQLVRLTGAPATPDAAPFFSLSQVLGPEPDACAPSADAPDCEDQWRHFAAEAGLLRADAGVPPDLPDAGGRGRLDATLAGDAEVVAATAGGGAGAGGCGPAGARPGPLGAALCALSGACLAALRRRPRSNFSSPRRSRKLRAIFRSDAQRAGRSQGGWIER